MAGCRAARTHALCGPSGSGKSSIISLTLRFYDPHGGALYVDGTPLRAIDASWWRRRAALVAQEPVLVCRMPSNPNHPSPSLTLRVGMAGLVPCWCPCLSL